MSKRHGIMSSDIIPALICRPTKGRTITMANHAHPPEGIMSKRHGIMSSDIIPAPIRVRPEGE